MRILRVEERLGRVVHYPVGAPTRTRRDTRAPRLGRVGTPGVMGTIVRTDAIPKDNS